MTYIPLFTKEEAEKMEAFDYAIDAVFVPMKYDQYVDLITHCKVCRSPRREVPLNVSGYCSRCWHHIPVKFRTPSARGHAVRRMYWHIRNTAKRLERELKIPRLVWSETRKTWHWSLTKSHLMATVDGGVREIVG